MPLDGYFMYHLTNEFKQALTGVRIKKVRQTSKDTFVLSYHKKGDHYLIFELNPNKSHVRLSENSPYGESPSNLLNAMRRLLENAEIARIYQHLMDRVMVFEFQKLDAIFGYQYYQLIYETMGRTTNLILLENNLVVDAYYKQFSIDKRSILNKSEFTFFPSDKRVYTPSDYPFLCQLDSPKTFMNTFMGFALDTASYFVEQKQDPLSIVCVPTLVLEPKKQFYPFNPNPANPHQTFESLSLLLEHFFQSETPKYVDIEKLIDKEIKRLELKLNHLYADLNDNLGFETFKQQAESIYLLAPDLNQKSSKLGELNLDHQKTLNENAQALYQKYHKAKKALEPIEKQIQLAKEYLNYYQNMKLELPYLSTNDLDDIKKELGEVGLIKLKISPKKKTTKPTLLTYKREDFEIYIGKTAEQNNYLTNVFAQPNDLWFHVQQGPGAHLILRGAFHEQSLRLCAMLAAYHSPQRSSSSIPVDYTRVRFIKKIKGLPGYNVTYTNQKTIYIDIDETKIKSL
jgi:predicted ribosome quality control (RQC) complex YloA/Tae2 family protein